MRPRLESNAIAANERAGGLVAGIRFVQFVPSYSQVSAESPPPTCPPNSTVLPCLASYAIAAPVRSDGLLAVITRCHVGPSSSHVNESANTPPNKTSLP